MRFIDAIVSAPCASADRRIDLDRSVGLQADGRDAKSASPTAARHATSSLPCDSVRCEKTR